ncbi:hypothetical protein VPH35_117127 [Triticum aestivum]
MRCYCSTTMCRQFNATTTGRSISPPWTCPPPPSGCLSSRCGQGIGFAAAATSSPTRPSQAVHPSQLPGRLCRATFRPHLGLPYASPTPAGAHVPAHRPPLCSSLHKLLLSACHVFAKMSQCTPY